MEEQQKIELKPTIQTYLRLAGTVAADVLSIAALYQAFDLWLAVILSVIVVAVTAWAAWKNNSLTTGAIAADVMKDVLTDAANVQTITGTWNDVQTTAGQVYTAIKEKAEQK